MDLFGLNYVVISGLALHFKTNIYHVHPCMSTPLFLCEPIWPLHQRSLVVVLSFFVCGVVVVQLAPSHGSQEKAKKEGGKGVLFS